MTRRLDDSESLLLEHWYSRAQMANRFIREDEDEFERLYRNGVVESSFLEALAEDIEAMSEVYDEYLDKSTRCVLRRNAKRAFVRCRRERPSLVVEPIPLPEIYSTEVHPLSSLVDRPRVESSGPHAPPSSFRPSMRSRAQHTRRRPT